MVVGENMKQRRLLIGTLMLGAVLLNQYPASADGTLWKKYNDAGQEAYREGRYVDAERLLLSAIEEAKKLGGQDPRLATSSNNLGELYRVQGKYSQAESLYQTALAILEKAQGPEDPDVATTLNNLGLLYRAQ